jgi:hypothetical protein
MIKAKKSWWPMPTISTMKQKPIIVLTKGHLVGIWAMAHFKRYLNGNSLPS